ncbi:Zinc/cadmium resistance protein [Halotydeus destructor]|nr:Zinc/cadmium resistance protein [Halotydeus destructor]
MEDARDVMNKIVFMMLLTLAVFLIEITVGYMTKAQSLVADAFHMLSDIVAMSIAYYSIKLSTSKAKSASLTFGWARAEDLGAMANGVFLIALSFTIIIESIKRFYEPEDITSPLLVLIVGTMGLIVNIIALVMFHPHKENDATKMNKASSPVNYFKSQSSSESARREKKINHRLIEKLKKPLDFKEKPNSQGTGSRDKDKPVDREPDIVDEPTKVSNSNSEGIFLHELADFLGSLIVVFSALVLLLTNWKYSAYLDPALSLISAALIIMSTKPLLVRSAAVLLQTVPNHINVEHLEQDFLAQFKQATAIHDFHVWQLTGETIIATTHVVCDQRLPWSPESYMQLADEMKDFFHERNIHSTTIQIEFRARLEHSSQYAAGEGSESGSNKYRNSSLLENDKNGPCVVPCDAKNVQTCCPASNPSAVSNRN